jgi:signal transduction histidine kinase
MMEHTFQINNIQNNAQFELAARMAHDIRSPIAIMTLSLNSIEKYNIDLSIMRAAIQRLRDIANYTLEKYRDSPKSHSALLLPLLQEVVALKRFEWSNRDCQLDALLNAISQSTAVYGSTGEIKSMLSNLLNNAIEACDTAHASIQIDVNSNNEFIELRITDNGAGIPSEKITHYLDGESSKHSGPGLGLMTAKKYMEQIDGKLSLSSQLDIGTIVTLQFKRIVVS